jgi:hypothetical protein
LEVPQLHTVGLKLPVSLISTAPKEFYEPNWDARMSENKKKLESTTTNKTIEEEDGTDWGDRSRENFKQKIFIRIQWQNMLSLNASREVWMW